MRRATFLKTLITAVTIGFPRLLHALTGRVLPTRIVDKDHTIANYGWIAVQFSGTPDPSWATSWCVVTSTGPTGYLAVTPNGSTTYRAIRTGTYAILFRRGTGNTHTLPPNISQTTVVNDKVTIHYITYT